MTALSPKFDDLNLALADSEQAAVIDYKNVSLSYGKKKALNDVSVSLKPGQIIALVGPNGAGKSTFVEVLMGLKKPQSGSVSVLNIDILKHPQQHLSKIGVQLQETKVFSKLSGRDYLQFFSRLYAETLAIEEIIAKLDLEDFIDQRIDNISGGQKQRIALGLAIINNPDLIILDEPTVGLDPIARKQFWRFIKALQSDGKTLLFTTHYMDEVRSLASHVVVLANGTVVAQGTPDEIVRYSTENQQATLDDAYEILIEQSAGAQA
ncbi:ABC transporter ATP-binding protein [Glaciecola sp. MH2013]|uniref:ABC transporter ATP-binding protein n=1 Tax=Glaciecola sp. MH2013 TaxID=2785524 RepID=UPI00189F35B1|nr:ABC transporter ATP-binding protein [Glaciecola sp. MH2013]MBF7073486.1 ABC transporter ATP-binding protein [Glaciecola sp. MH2013]